MKKFSAFSSNVAFGLTALIVTGCSPAEETKVAALPVGETDLSCAAVIYAANSLIDDKKIEDASGVIKEKYFGALTKYTVAHGTAKGLEGSDGIGAVKIHAFGMMGIGSSSNKVPADKILERAKLCIGV